MKNTQVFSVIGLLAIGGAGLGCFGADPNQNSQNVNGDGAATTGGGGAGGTTNPNGPIVGNPIATFDTGVNGFVVNPYHDTSQVNLGDPNSGATGGAPTLSFDGTQGNPAAGSLQVVAPYSGANQYVDIQNTSMFGTVPANWMGGTLHVRVKVDSGSFVGVVEPYAITIPKSFVFGGTSTNFAKNNDWQEFTVNLTSPMHADSGYDPKQVIIFGLQLSSGGSGAAQQPVTFHIDSFSVSGIAAPSTDGGAGGAGGVGGGAGGAGGGPRDASGG